MACIAPPPARYRRALLVSLVVFIVLTIALGYTRLLSLDALLPTDMHIPVLQKPRGRTGADRPMSYGETARPAFKDLPHPLATLDPALVPAADNNRRLIIIGDVHGMLAPLEALLKKLNHSAAPVSKGPEGAVYDDHLVFLGDMVNKGPNTPGVIDLLLRHNASAVRGNHEDRVLLTRADRATPRVADESAGGDEGPAAPDNLEQQHVISSNRGNKADHDTLRSLSAAHLDYLASLPAISTWARSPASRPRSSRHAASFRHACSRDARETLVRAAADALRASPAYRTGPLKRKQLPGQESRPRARAGGRHGRGTSFARTRKPDADRRVAVPSEAHDGHAWAPVWDAAQKRAETDEGRIAVVYGHDAKRGLHVGEYAFGLDSGCVRGGKLSALVVAAREGGPVEHHVVQVDCEKPDKRREL
ncbi:ser/Thr protein phosphatase family [Verticillium alfalfae VaMs.102]|uniref:Ser/Thr protein phosphatase family n=1 Tax=Verticillium alfalfae (strain VaMs.102 / ATCC MYA-4576 / FGSC 10136) TaxID=526221 RepID=C9S9I7_VERA1|nr:ser/Thr protein phosphatase family [Verticillium alfalfae VaMs.102]EEY16050.1 ser/Thr protein phosphatase family [Verticillium alfalfae VaMs.102]